MRKSSTGALRQRGDREGRRSLLANESPQTAGSPDRAVVRLSISGGGEAKGGGGGGGSGGGGRDLMAALGSTLKDAADPADALIQAAFIVHFDTKLGNVVEWVTPAGFGIESPGMGGIEYKAMPSGCHNVTEDFVYFKHVDSVTGDRLFGLACFHNMTVDANGDERGSRMRSVGVLAPSYAGLPQHLAALQDEAVQCNADPGNYARLQAYFDAHRAGGTGGNPGGKGGTSPGGAMGDPPRALSSGVRSPWGGLGKGGPNTDRIVDLDDPTRHTLAQIFQFFGPSIFTIWKALLLRMRVLFYTPVPVGAVCNRVHAVCSLSDCDERAFQALVEPQPVFFVNVADIDDLSGMETYGE